jgi:hypothetical protein
VNRLLPADWDTTVLDNPQVSDPDPSGHGGPLAVAAATALDPADPGVAAQATRALGHAGVVAVRHRASVSEVHETLHGWQLLASSAPTPDPADLAGAAIVRAARLAEARRTTGADL